MNKVDRRYLFCADMYIVIRSHTHIDTNVPNVDVRAQKHLCKWTYTPKNMGKLLLSLSVTVPELGTIRCPPWELKEPKAVQEGSLVRSNVWVCVRRPIVLSLLSRRQCGSLGDSLEESSPRSSCGVTKPEELYTLIFRLGSGSSRGELVMGILSVTSWRA